MRKHSRSLAILFLMVAGGLFFYTTKKDEAEIQVAVEDRVVAATAEREREMEAELAERKRSLEAELAERKRSLEAQYAASGQAVSETLATREEALQRGLAELDSARAALETPVYYRLSAQTIEQVLRRMGLDYESSVDDDGDPKFEFKLATYDVVIYTNACEEEGCANLRIYAGFDTKPSPEIIIEWGRTKRYATAYLSEEGKARLDNDFIVKGGITLGAVETFILNFRDRLGEFATHIDF